MRVHDMNVALTRAVDGFARRAFTVDEILRMIDAGVIGRDEKFELIEGEIVPVSPHHDPHEAVKSALTLYLARWLPHDLRLGIESSIYLSDRTFVEPDLSIFERKLTLKEVRGPDLLLVIEVADSSGAFDLGVKARLYASYGVPELYVVDAETRVTTVHTGPTAAGWASIREVPPTESLHPTTLPGLFIRLADAD
jgi:Uma2 family endonuclease